MTVVVKPLYERGNYCGVCQQVTIHRHIGPQHHKNGGTAFHLWDCTECGATVSLDSPEKVALRCFRTETRRMKQRRVKRRYG